MSRSELSVVENRWHPGDPDSALEPVRDVAGNGILAPPAARCSSRERRDPNESEGPEMMPGRACTSCHALSNSASGEGDAPIFAFAGTLFSTAHEPDDCFDSRVEGAIPRGMVGLQQQGDCNQCHTAAGHSGAPGRILLP